MPTQEDWEAAHHLLTRPGQMEQQEETALRLLAEKNLYEFLCQAWQAIEPQTPFIPTKNVQIVCDHLQAAIAGDIQNLLIAVPPGSTKSIASAVMLPAWTWIDRPNLRFLYASHSHELSLRDSVRCRWLIQSPWYQERWANCFRLIGDQNIKSNFANNHYGFRQAESAHSSTTGFRSDVLVIDDAHDAKKVESEVERRSVIGWHGASWVNRVNDYRTSRRIVIGQRVHMEDLMGILQRSGDYEYLCLPEEYDPAAHCITHRKDGTVFFTDWRSTPGELLRPERFGKEQIAEQKKPPPVGLGERGYAAQHQQRPVPKAGGMFQAAWFNKFLRAPLKESYRVRFWDLAHGSTGDWTVGTLLASPLGGDGKPDGRIVVEHVQRGRWEPFERDEIIMATARRDRLRFGPDREPRIWIEQEPSAGKDACQYLIGKLVGFPVFAERPVKSKEIRAEPLASQAAAGNVYLVDGGASEGIGAADWDIPAWLDEISNFPFAAHDDMVDSVTGAFGKLATMRQLRVPQLLSYGIRRTKGERRIYWGSREELKQVVMEERSILIYFGEEMPEHGLLHLLGSLAVPCGDIDPADAAVQERWGAEVERQLFDKNAGKRIWSLCTRKFPSPWESLVVVDDGDRRAFSAVVALADGYNLRREVTLAKLADPEWVCPKDAKAGSQYIYSLLRSARGLVVT